jgi:putative Ca2+/H+ antiporter (TMEM165/GDT1 family)
MESFGISFILVALVAVGDRTRLLGLILSAERRRRVAVLLGIFVTTLANANHLAAAAGGACAAAWIGPGPTRWIVGLGSIAFGLWILRPDQITDESGRKSYSAGAFLGTVIWFFLVEIGDKTEIATVGLAVKYGIATVVGIPPLRTAEGRICGKSARTDLCGGRPAMDVPTAIPNFAYPIPPSARFHAFRFKHDRCSWPREEPDQRLGGLRLLCCDGDAYREGKVRSVL